jgi:hypothetical protein
LFSERLMENGSLSPITAAKNSTINRREQE